MAHVWGRVQNPPWDSALFSSSGKHDFRRKLHLCGQMYRRLGLPEYVDNMIYLHVNLIK